ncbi:MAG: hypothetical protein GY855_01810 [candidate division Zixibacteria bacterium]|nr:hypothetical protein [candidate division Zixibacteria bacterium]
MISALSKIIISIIAVLLVSSAAYALLGECQPYGDILLDNEMIEDGLPVKAMIGNDIVASGRTTGGGYSLSIQPDNLDTPQKDGWLQGDLITIQVDGRIASPSFEAFLGSQRHNLRIATLDIKLDTWGKIKALFK